MEIRDLKIRDLKIRDLKIRDRRLATWVGDQQTYISLVAGSKTAVRAEGCLSSNIPDQLFHPQRLVARTVLGAQHAKKGFFGAGEVVRFVHLSPFILRHQLYQNGDFQGDIVDEDVDGIPKWRRIAVIGLRGLPVSFGLEMRWLAKAAERESKNSRHS